MCINMGSANAGLYYEIAETKVTQVMDHARKHQHPAVHHGKNERLEPMPSFSRNLEQSLHRALAIANERHHEYATRTSAVRLTDDVTPRSCGLFGRSRLLKKIFANISTRTRQLISEDRRTPSRWRDFNASSSERSFMFSPRGGRHRRQCARRDFCRAREPRRLFPAGAGHDQVRRGQLHQPRDSQAAGPF